MIKRVAIFSYCGYDAINAPLLNSAHYLSDQGFHVDIFARNAGKMGVPRFESPLISYYTTTIPVGRIQRGLARIKLLRTSLRLMRGHSYAFAVGLDPTAFQHAWFAARTLRIPCVYHSLEFHPAKSLKQRLRRFFEHCFIRRADWVITQDDLRADWLCQTHSIRRERISVLHNTSHGDCLPEKSPYLRSRFSIPADRTVVLAVGSLISEHMILEAVRSIPAWPPSFVLVIHGWFPDPNYEQAIREESARHRRRVFISTEFLPVEKKYDVFQSCDVGLVIFSPADDNTRLVGAAAGKLFEFTRCGVPVVANDLPGMRALVEGRCGRMCAPRLEDAGQALACVAADYDRLRTGSLAFFSEHSFSSGYRNFLRAFSKVLNT